MRFPDALVTCTAFPDTELLAPDPVVVFEVVSPTSGRTDRVEKVAEYAAVPSILRYVIVETRFAGLLVLHRTRGGEPWTAGALGEDRTLDVPEVRAAIPVAEIYDGVVFAGEG